MKIGIFTNNYFPRVTGVAYSIENFKKGLEKLGNKVYIFAPKYKKDKEEKDTYRFKSISFPQERGHFYYPLPIPYSLKIKKIIQNLDLDIIHSQHPYLLGKTAKQFSKELDIPIVFTNHTLYHKYFDRLPLDLGRIFKPFVLKKVINYANQCNLTIVPTKGMAEIFIKNGLKKPLSVIPSSIDYKKFIKVKPGRIKKEYNLRDDDILILTVSRLSYEKNIDFLIKVFANILSNEKKLASNLYFMIIGDGLERKKLESQAASLGIRKKIIFTGEINYQKLPLYYSSADIFVYSSLIDAQALVLVEAMASGLPIVAIGEALGPRETIKINKTGFLVRRNQKDFAKQVLRLIENPFLRKYMAENSKKEAKNYSIEVLTQKLLKAYNSLLDKKN